MNNEIIKQENIRKILKQFIGKMQQYPPMYSAIKINGKKLYEYARKGQQVEVKPRNIEIYDIELQNIDEENKNVVFTVKCSKGTYIRTLCEDIANKLNTIGCMKELERIQVGEFNINESLSIKELRENDNIEKHIIKIEDIFKNNREIELEENKLQLFLNGVKLKNNSKDGIYKIYCNTTFIGIGEVKNNLLKRDVII